ncbi:hypothetical protein [Williamsia deligens]|uniref:Excreted virulence factor EspC (Type VII ESX diderm) n=1 Tax=Williamsia deligens TaxID=321325 RepID=A0ABW3G8P7_9NOCA|nr:hypothetical protein [Williamsia deligens]MCP2192739.1 hypothetical protein [Williamsia deligens]
MDSVKADIDHLNALGGTLQQLSSEAAGLKTQHAAGSASTMQSVSEATSIDSDIIGGALVPAIEERLGETGEIMVAVAKQYQDRDGANSQMIADSFSAATGDWSTGGTP